MHTHTQTNYVVIIEVLIPDLKILITFNVQFTT